MISTPFEERVVLITGAGRGLGRDLALAFAAHGARLAANDLTPINLDETIALVRARGGCISEHVHDVAKKMPVQALIESVRDEWGHLDMVINSTVVRPQAALLEMDEWDWRRTIDVNLAAAFFLLQSAGRVMRDQGGGVILNLAEHPALADTRPGEAAFQASQAGLLALTRTAAMELRPHQISVNAICLAGYPGGQKWSGERPPAMPASLAEALRDPLSLALFLGNPAAASLSGQIYQFNDPEPRRGEA